MEISVSYILSQIFSILSYICLGTTFYLKNRKKVLMLGFFQTIFLVIGYFFLHQYQGMAMITVGLITNVVFYIDEQKNGKTDKIEKKDIIMLLCILTYTIILAIITYSEPLSLLSVFATVVWIISVWIKQVKLYKLISIPDTILWLAFNIYAKSISGIIVEIVLLGNSILGYKLEIKSDNNSLQTN